jgi:hypothetical protein
MSGGLTSKMNRCYKGRAVCLRSFRGYFTTRVKLHDQWFVEVGWGFLGILLSYWVLRRYYFAWLYLAAKPSYVGVDMDGLACPLHCPTICGHQTRG